MTETSSPSKTFTPTIKLEHADSRGEIYSIELPDNRELMLIHSMRGAFRGGHHHDCDEVVVLLSGDMVYHKIEDGLHIAQQPLPKHGTFNPAGQDHMGQFLQDSWLVEYKFAKKGEWTQQDYEPFREMVRASQR